MEATPPDELPSRSGLIPSQQQIAIYHEAMLQLRHLSDDVWQGLRLFLALEGFLVAACLCLLLVRPTQAFWPLLNFLLSVFGILAGFLGRYIFKRHRAYYLQILAKKSLLEDEMGFYDSFIAQSDTDRALPWRLGPEAVKEIQQGFDAWVQRSVRGRGTIASFQFLIFEVLVGFFALLAVIVIRNWFFV